MIKLSKRATIYLDSKLHKILKYKALETSCSISKLVNEAVRNELTGDAEGLQAFKGTENEKTISFEELLKLLKAGEKI